MNEVVLGLYLQSPEMGCCHGEGRLQNVYFVHIFKIMYIDIQPVSNKTLWFNVVYLETLKYSNGTYRNSTDISVLLAVAPYF